MNFEADECKEDEIAIGNGSKSCFYERNYDPPVEKIEVFKEFQAYLESEYGFIVNLNYNKSDSNSSEGGTHFEISAINPKVY